MDKAKKRAKPAKKLLAALAIWLVALAFTPVQAADVTEAQVFEW